LTASFDISVTSPDFSAMSFALSSWGPEKSLCRHGPWMSLDSYQ
jgi:hypothetical protein